MTTLKIKLLPGGFMPAYQHEGDAGLDLKTPTSFSLESGGRLRVKLSVCIELPLKTVGLIQGRSGLAARNGITTIGNVIDENYRGEISAILVNTGPESIKFDAGDRIAQLLILPVETVILTEIPELTSTPRGDLGIGSTGL